jgi:hypothetical protein
MTKRTQTDSVHGSHEAVTPRAAVAVAQTAVLLDDAALRLRGVSPAALADDELYADVALAGLCSAVDDCLEAVDETLAAVARYHAEIKIADQRVRS